MSSTKNTYRSYTSENPAIQEVTIIADERKRQTEKTIGKDERKRGAEKSDEHSKENRSQQAGPKMVKINGKDRRKRRTKIKFAAALCLHRSVFAAAGCSQDGRGLGHPEAVVAYMDERLY